MSSTSSRYSSSLTNGVEKDYLAGNRVGPPPVEERDQHEAKNNCRRQDSGERHSMSLSLISMSSDDGSPTPTISNRLRPTTLAAV